MPKIQLVFACQAAHSINLPLPIDSQDDVYSPVQFLALPMPIITQEDAK